METHERIQKSEVLTKQAEQRAARPEQQSAHPAHRLQQAVGNLYVQAKLARQAVPSAEDTNLLEMPSILRDVLRFPAQSPAAATPAPLPGVSALLQASSARLEASSFSSDSGLLQRKGDCGSSKSPLVENCTECNSRALQRKLTIGASNDPMEEEADRIADQVLATSAQPVIASALPRIQRLSEQRTGQSDVVPASVNHVLASPGSPLELDLRQDMELRFGHDFSRVRVHSGAAAEQSAHDLSASAYTVGADIVFGAGRYAPGMHEGRRLIAHELAHVVQQSGTDGKVFGSYRHVDKEVFVRRVEQRAPSLVIQRQPTPPASTPTYFQLDARTIDVQQKITSAITDAEKNDAKNNALQLVRELEAALAQIQMLNPLPPGVPSADDVRHFIMRVSGSLIQNGFRKEGAEIAKQSTDFQVQATIIEKQLAPYPGTISEEQQFLMELSKIVGIPLPAKQPQESSKSWLETRTATIGRIFASLNNRGLLAASGKALGLELSSSLMDRYFKKSDQDPRPDPLGRVRNLSEDPTSHQLLADCDVLATYAMRLLILQGWTPVGYMMIMTNEIKPDKSGPRDSHVVAIVKRGDAYLGVSNTEFKDLGIFANDTQAFNKLLELALSIYSPRLTQYDAYFLPAPTAGPTAGRYDLRLIDPVNNNLTPVFTAP